MCQVAVLDPYCNLLRKPRSIDRLTHASICPVKRLKEGESQDSMEVRKEERKTSEHSVAQSIGNLQS